MALRRFARPPTVVPENPLTRLPAPAQPVTDATAFNPAARYRVRLSGVVDYQGSPLSPMHVHTVTGAVAQAIRDKIAAFGPV